MDVDANIPLLAAFGWQAFDGDLGAAGWNSLGLRCRQPADAGDSVVCAHDRGEPALGEYGSTTSAASGDPTLVFQTATGLPAAASATLTTVPGPPQAVTLNGATISWSPPVEDGGALSWDHTVSARQFHVRHRSVLCADAFTGYHAVTVAARNVIGNGLASAPITVIHPCAADADAEDSNREEAAQQAFQEGQEGCRPKTSAGAKITWKVLDHQEARGQVAGRRGQE